jgi:hypothetical protein
MNPFHGRKHRVFSVTAKTPFFFLGENTLFFTLQAMQAANQRAITRLSVSGSEVKSVASHQDGAWQGSTTIHSHLETSRRAALSAPTSTGPPLVPLYTDPSAWESSNLSNENAPTLDSPSSLPGLCSSYFEKIPKVSSGGAGVHSTPIPSSPGAEVSAIVQSNASAPDSNTYLVIARTDGSVTVQPPPGSHLSRAGHEGLTLRIFSSPPPLSEKSFLLPVLSTLDLAAHATIGGGSKEWRDNLVFNNEGGVLLPPVTVAPNGATDGWSNMEDERGLLLVAASICVGCIDLEGKERNDSPYTPIPPTSVIRVLHLPKEALLVGGDFTISTTGCPSYRPSTSLSPPKIGGSAIVYDAYGEIVVDKKSVDYPLVECLPPPRWLSSVTLPIGVTVRALDVSSDGRYILASCSDACARVYCLQDEVITPPPLPSALAALGAKEEKLLRELSKLKLTTASSFTRHSLSVTRHTDLMDDDDEKDEAVILARTVSVRDGEDARVAAKWASLPLPKEAHLLFTAAPPSIDPLTAAKAQVPLASAFSSLNSENGAALLDTIPLHLSWQWECRRAPTFSDAKVVARAHDAALDETSRLVKDREGGGPSTPSNLKPLSPEPLENPFLSTTGVFLWWNVISHKTKSGTVRASAYQSCMQHIQRHQLFPSGRSGANHCFTPFPFPLSAAASFPSQFYATVPALPFPSLTRPIMLTGDTQGNVMAWEVPTMRLNEAEGSTTGALTPVALLGKHTLYPSAASLDPHTSNDGMFTFTPGGDETGTSPPTPSSAVTALAISPCGTWGISGTSCGQVYMYDLSNLYTREGNLTQLPKSEGKVDPILYSAYKQLGLFGGRLCRARGSLDHLHAARWDGVGGVRRVSFLSGAPNLAVCEVDCLGKGGSGVGRTLFVYDLLAGSLVCRVELEVSSEDGECEARVGSPLSYLMSPPPPSAPQWQSLPRGILLLSSLPLFSSPSIASDVQSSQGHGVHLTHLSVTSLLESAFPRDASLCQSTAPSYKHPLGALEYLPSLHFGISSLPSKLATDLLATAFTLSRNYSSESSIECSRALAFLAPSHLLRHDVSDFLPTEQTLAEAISLKSTSRLRVLSAPIRKTDNSSERRMLKASAAPSSHSSTSHLDTRRAGVIEAASFSTRVGMGLVEQGYFASDTSIFKGPRSPSYSIPSSPRNKMWGGEVEEQMVASTNLTASSSPSLSSLRSKLRIAPAASQVINAVASIGRYVPGPGGGGGGDRSPPKGFSATCLKKGGTPFVPPLFSAGNVDGDIFKADSAIGTSELAYIFAQRRREGRAEREVRIG